jgi:hypothetical protein
VRGTGGIHQPRNLKTHHMTSRCDSKLNGYKSNINSNNINNKTMNIEMVICKIDDDIFQVLQNVIETERAHVAEMTSVLQNYIRPIITSEM